MNYILILLLMCGYISPIVCAELLPTGGDPLFRGEKSPPHLHIQQFQLQYPSTVSKTTDQAAPSFAPEPNRRNDHQSFIPEKTCHSSSCEASKFVFNPQEAYALKLFCTRIQTTPKQLPNDAYLNAENYALIQQVNAIKEVVDESCDTPLNFAKLKEDLTDLDDNIPTVCKLAICLANQLDFFGISEQNAPFQLLGLSPAHQRSLHYCEAMDCPDAGSTSDDDEYYHSARRSHTTWTANLLMAISKAPKSPDQSTDIFKKFMRALPNTTLHEESEPEEYIQVLIHQLDTHRLSKADPGDLNGIYLDALTSGFLCKHKGDFVSQKAGYVAALINRHCQYTCRQEPNKGCSHIHDFAAKWLDLYRDTQPDSPLE